MLEVLLHTALRTLREPDDNVSDDTLLSECESSTADLCQILFEFFGRTMVQPCREIFEKDTGLSVSQSTSSGFLTTAESVTAMATARQHNLINTHIDAVRSSTCGGRGRGSGKNTRRGARRGASRGGSRLQHLQPTRPSAPPSAPPSTSLAPQQQQQRQQRQQQQPAGGPAASSATTGREQSTLLARGRGRGRGKGQ